MKRITKALIFVLYVLITGCATIGSIRPTIEPPTNQSEKKPIFSVETINVLNPEKNEKSVAIFTKIPFPELTFKQVGNDKWMASYIIEAQFKFDGYELAYDKFHVNTPVCSRYDIENQSQLSVYVIKYTYNPGQYILNLRVTDKLSKNTSSISMPITIRDYEPDRINISDLLFIKGNADINNILTPETDILNESPANSQYLNPWISTKFAFEIYHPKGTTEADVSIEYKLFFNKNAVFEFRQTHMVTNVVNQKQIARIQFSLPDNLGSGNYDLMLKVYASYDSVGYTITKPIRFYSLFPKTEWEIKTAVDPMAHMKNPPLKILKKIKKAKTNKEKTMIFNEFWEAKGDSATEEFYNRVAYANKHFKSWRTQQGMVLLKFGYPSDVETILPAAFFRNETYEIWHYWKIYSADPNFVYENFPGIYHDVPHKSFLFVDEQGMGNFTFGHVSSNGVQMHNQIEFND